MNGPGGDAIAEVSVQEAWTRLTTDPQVVLIDVRTHAEWTYVGIPDLTSLGKKPVLMEWQAYPDSRVHADFAQRLQTMLSADGIDQSYELLFLCRSGARSMMAARTMAAAGFARSVNVAAGFEGHLDPARHRGQHDGWKAAGLPWVQG